MSHHSSIVVPQPTLTNIYICTLYNVKDVSKLNHIGYIALSPESKCVTISRRANGAIHKCNFQTNNLHTNNFSASALIPVLTIFSSRRSILFYFQCVLYPHSRQSIFCELCMCMPQLRNFSMLVYVQSTSAACCFYYRVLKANFISKYS